jgi:hypothetical protein
MSTQMLVEKWDGLISSKKAKPVKEGSKKALATLLESQENWVMTEGSSTALGDIAQFTPILVPAVRRIFPNLLANEIVGVQPMNGPTGFAFALRYAYEGAGGKNSINGNAPGYPGAPSNFINDPVQGNSQSFGGAALVLSGSVPYVIGADFIVDATGNGSAESELFGTVAHAEYDAGQGLTKILVNITKTGADSISLKTALDTGTPSLYAGGAYKVLGTDTNLLGYFNNEAGYNLIFKNYVARLTTSDGEYKDRATMKSMKMKIEKTSVDVQTRVLKAEYSTELAQDLKAVHGLDAEAELVNILEYEIAAELDRDLVDAIHNNCTNGGTWSYGSVGQIQVASTGNTAITTPVQTADARWEMEKFRTLYTRIVREANAVALQTRIGAANFVIASLNVVSALETLSNFMYSQVPGNVEPQIGVAKVGTLDGRFTVYLDTFAMNDFFIVGFKGNGTMNTGIIYCPYVPLQMVKVTDPSTFQPLIGFKTRDCIISSLWGASKYYRKVTCNFTGSSFISGSYYI